MKSVVKFGIVLIFSFLLCACAGKQVPVILKDYTPPAIKTDGHAFIFAPETKDKNVHNDRWKVVVAAEKEAPSFEQNVLHMDAPDLRNDWQALYVFLADADMPAKLRYVNSFFNKFPFKDDDANWGGPYWTTPHEFLQKGSGDCEDYAITKYYALKALGVSANDMFITVVGYPDKNGMHAILVVLDGDDYYVLDNLKKDTVYKNSTDKAFYVRQYYNESLSKSQD